MSASKFNVYCNLIDYVKTADPALYDLLTNTCTSGTLSSTRGKAGITLLMPNDELKAKILKAATSSDETEYRSACDMLNSLIMRDVFKTTKDWLAKKDDIPNSLFPSQHVEVESASGTEVKFKNGAVAVLDPKFKDGSPKSNLAVWKLTKGEIGLKNPPSTGKYVVKKKAKPARGGAYEISEAEARSSLRYKIGLTVEIAYAHQHLHYNTLTQHCILSDRARDVYLEYVLSLLSFICREDHSLFVELAPLVSYQKIDFYLLVEPHGAHAETPLISDDLLERWWAQYTTPTPCCCQKTIDDLNLALLEPADNMKTYKCFTARAKLREVTQDIRRTVIEQSRAAPRQCVDAVVRAYGEISRSNSISGVGPVFPPVLSQRYNLRPELKVMEDELRYVTTMLFDELENAAIIDALKYNSIVKMIAEYSRDMSLNRADNMKLLNGKVMRYLINPVENLDEICTFINSTNFLFFAMPSVEYNNYEYKSVLEKPPAGKKGFFNIGAAIVLKHKRAIEYLDNKAGDVPSEKAVIEFLKNLNADIISPTLKEHIMRLASGAAVESST